MKLEDQYFNIISLAHRKKFSQFYTIPKIAELMMNWIMEGKPKEIYDPAFGMGIFYNVAKHFNFTGKFIATELDNVAFDFYKKNASYQNNLYLKNEDYLSSWDCKYDAIICNPPYLKFQKILGREEIFNKLSSIFNEKISGYTNISSIFLLKSIFELNPNGRLAYIMPLEFLNTGYGKIVKKIMLENGSIDEIIYIKDEIGAFEAVTTTVCIIFFRKSHTNKSIKFSIIENIKELFVNTVNVINYSNIKIDSKWLIFFEKNNNDVKIPKSFVPLNVYGKFKRGIATGANDFFSLNKERIVQLKLDEINDVSICLTKSHQIKSSIFTQSNLEYLINTNSNVYIFNPNQISSLSEEAKNYILYGEKLGYHNGYLTRNRKQWFLLEKRNPFPILFSVFSRDGYKIIRNKTNSLSLTCFHGFEPNSLGEKYVDKIFLFLKSELGTKMLCKNRRKYGGNLDKFEPSDLNAIVIPSPEQFDLISEETIVKEMYYLEKTDSISSEMDNFFTNLLNN